MAQQDFRFVHVLTEMAPAEAQQVIMDRYQEELSGSRATLHHLMNEAKEEIEQSVVDGLILDERARLAGELEQVEEEAVLNFVPIYERLRKVTEEVKTLRNNRSRRARAAMGRVRYDT